MKQLVQQFIAMFSHILLGAEMGSFVKVEDGAISTSLTGYISAPESVIDITLQLFVAQLQEEARAEGFDVSQFKLNIEKKEEGIISSSSVTDPETLPLNEHMEKALQLHKNGKEAEADVELHKATEVVDVNVKDKERMELVNN